MTNSHTKRQRARRGSARAGLTRRTFLQSVAGAGAGAALTSMWPYATARADVGGKLRMFTWEGYDLQDVMADWRKKHDVDLSTTYLSTQDDIQAKFVGGSAPTYDLATYNQSYYALYARLGIMKPLSTDEVPNYSAERIYDPFYRKKWWWFDGNLWGVPWTWGSYVCLYNPAQTEPPESWNELADSKYRNRLAIMDDPLASWPAAARIAGYEAEYPNLTRKQVDDTMRKMREFKKNARAIVGLYGDLASMFVAGEVDVTFASWAAVNIWTGQQGVETRSTVPKEGSSSFCDAYFVPASAENEDTAHAFINEVLEPRRQAAAAKVLAGGVVTPEALEHLDEPTRGLYPYDRLAEYLETVPFYRLPPRESDKYATYNYWLQSWQDFKAA